MNHKRISLKLAIVGLIAALALVSMLIVDQARAEAPQVSNSTSSLLEVGEVAYVPMSYNYNSLALIDTNSHSTIGTVDVGQYGCYRPKRARLTPDGSELYVLCEDSQNIVILDTVDNSFVATINRPGVCQQDVAFVQAGLFALATSSGCGEIYQIDVIETANHSIVRTIDTYPNAIMSIAAHPLLPLAYAAAALTGNSGSVLVINTDTFTVETSISTGAPMWGVQPSPDGAWVYATNNSEVPGVLKINAQNNEIVGSIGELGALFGMQISPDGSKLYVASGFYGWVYVIDTTDFSLITNLWVGGTQYEMALTCDGSELYIARAGFDYISVINTENYGNQDDIYLPGASTEYGMALCPPSLGGSIGNLQGRVTDAATGNPIEHGRVSAAPGLFEAITDADGYYQMDMIVGIYTATASAFGYYPVSAQVEIITDTTTTQDFSLEPAPTALISGTVTDSLTGWPMYAFVAIDGYPQGGMWTNPVTGFYSLSLIMGSAYDVTVNAWVGGYLVTHRQLDPLYGSRTENFTLDADPESCDAPGYRIIQNTEDFESGNGSYTVYGNNSSWEYGNPGSAYPDPEFGTAHSGSYVWGNNLDGNYNNNEDSYLQSPDIDLTPVSGHNVELSWWQVLWTEGLDAVDVQVSNDGGQSWTTVYGPVSGHPDHGWTQKTAILDSSFAVFNFQVRFHLYSDGYNNYRGMHIDDVSTGACVPQEGGLVVGNVADFNLGTPLTGAQVSDDVGGSTWTLATLDPVVSDSFYLLFSPPGTHTFTAEYPKYQAVSVQVDVPAGGTVLQDFSLPAGMLEADPNTLAADLPLGDIQEVQLSLANIGSAPASFELDEQGQGFTPGVESVPGGSVVWLYQDTTGVAVSGADNGTAMAYPAAYKFIPDHPSAQANILVYADDWIHLPPYTLVQQAISILNLPATVHVNADFYGFENDLNYGGPWDLVIYSSENYYPSGSVRNALLSYLQRGGKLAATDLRQMDSPGDPLWAEMGFTFLQNYLDPKPVYWWQPGHPIFNTPSDAPEWLNRTAPSAVSQGTIIDPLGNSEMVAGYTASSQPGQGALVIRGDGMSVYKAMRDVTIDADADMDGVNDGVELWENIIFGLLNGFAQDAPWLFEEPVSGTIPAGNTQPVTITFDASHLGRPGEYRAQLSVRHDTPYNISTIPVTLTTTVPADWGRLTGTVAGKGYCDQGSEPINEAQLVIQSSTGMSWTLKTEPDGTFYWYLDEDGNPYDIEVTFPGYQPIQVTGISVSHLGDTLQDFSLRWDKPCITETPPSLETTLVIGMNDTQVITLTNTGAAASNFELREMNRGYKPLPKIQGPFASITSLVPVGQQQASNTLGLDLPALPEASPLAAGDVIRSWQAGEPDHAWGIAFDGDSGNVWAGDGWVSERQIFEYTADGSLTGRTYNYAWNPAYGPADDAFNWNTGMLWTLDVATDNCLHEMDPVNGYTGNIICGPWSASQRGVAYDPISDTWFVGGWNDYAIYHIDSNGALIDSAHVGLPISGLAYNPSTSHLFVMVNDYSEPVYVLDAANYYALVGQFYIDGWPGLGNGAGLEIDCDGNLWAVGQNERKVYEIDSGETTSVCLSDVAWLSEVPVTGTLPADVGVVPIEVTFDASVLSQPGTYSATLVIKNDDPHASNLPVAATLIAQPSANMGKATGTVTDDWTGDALNATVELVGVYTMQASPDYSIWAVEGVYSLTAYTEGYYTVTLPVEITAGEITVQDIALEPAMPRLGELPEQINMTLPRGSSGEQVFELQNTGPLPLDFAFNEFNPLENLASTNNLAGKHILFDQAHCQPERYSYSYISSDLVDAGAVIDENNAPFDESTLEGYDILWLIEGGCTWGYGELQILEAWLNDGGTILIQGENSLATLPPASIIGINYQNGACNIGTTTNIKPHPVTEGVDSFYIEYTCGFITGSPEAIVLDQTANPHVIAAVHGLGKMLVVADDDFVDWVIDNDDNRLLAMNAFRWLSAPAYSDIPWLSETPEQGVIDGHGSLDSLLNFDAAILTPGVYEGLLAVEHNDPNRRSPVLIPVQLTVTDQVAPASITISGSQIGLVREELEFSALVAPDFTVQPLTYVWEAAGQQTITHTGTLTDTVSFMWEITGTQQITVTASNDIGSVTSTFQVSIIQVIYSTYVPLAQKSQSGGLNSGLPLDINASNGNNPPDPWLVIHRR